MTTISNVAVVGTGVIGASWAALFLANGLDVVASDPAAGAESALRRAVDEAWPALERIGLADGAARARLRFTLDPADAVSAAHFVQESGPENEQIKAELYARIERTLSGDAIVASSSSGLLISPLQKRVSFGDRLVIGHPFNPPHLLPLVEIVAGEHATEHTTDRAAAFYRRLGKRPITVHAEVHAHIANRLQAALWREALSLVQKGIASAEEVDIAIAAGPGLRWALFGPFTNLHLSGGAGGIAHLLDHLGPSFEVWWDDLGTPKITAELRDKVAEQVTNMIGDRDPTEIARWRDARVLDMLAIGAGRNEVSER